MHLVAEIQCALCHKSGKIKKIFHPQKIMFPPKTQAYSKQELGLPLSLQTGKNQILYLIDSIVIWQSQFCIKHIIE